MIPPERLKKGLALFNAGGATHLVGDLYSVSTKGGQYKAYVTPGRWSCNCTWGGVYSGGWNQFTPCYHAIAAAAAADIDIPLGPPKKTEICQHCERTIVQTVEGTWIDPEATGDDDIWSDTCDSHDTFIADHEPVVDDPFKGLEVGR